MVWLFALFNFLIDGIKDIRETFIEKEYQSNLRTLHDIKISKRSKEKNIPLFSSKVTKHPNKRKHLEKYCRYFYSANTGLLFIVKQTRK